MRAWAVVVPRERAEAIRKDLLARGLLEKHLRIAREGNSILLPTTERVNVGLPTKEREFDEGFVAVRSYKEIVDVPAGLRPSLPTSFDVVGDIAVIKVPEELRAHRQAIGQAILRWNTKLATVVEDRGVKGEHRVREVDVIAGAKTTTTVHTEHGLRYRVDLSHAYFSPRLASERMRIAELTRDGERIADPFAGVGPYSILIAKRRRPREVFASDSNPTAVELLKANVAANRAEHVTVGEGEAQTILKRIAPVDRVILDLPHSASKFLPDALAAIGPSGTVHLYEILEEAEEKERQQAVRSIASAAGFHVTDVSHRHVRAYSPTKYHTAFDITVARA